MRSATCEAVVCSCSHVTDHFVYVREVDFSSVRFTIY